MIVIHQNRGGMINLQTPQYSYSIFYIEEIRLVYDLADFLFFTPKFACADDNLQFKKERRCANPIA